MKSTQLIMNDLIKPGDTLFYSMLYYNYSSVW